MGVIKYPFEKAGTNWESERAWGLFVIFLFFFWLFVNLLIIRWVLLSKFNKLIVILSALTRPSGMVCLLWYP